MPATTPKAIKRQRKRERDKQAEYKREGLIVVMSRVHYTQRDIVIRNAEKLRAKWRESQE